MLHCSMVTEAVRREAADRPDNAFTPIRDARRNDPPVMLRDVEGSWQETPRFWCYRIGGFILLNLVDDPAWLALMFC